MAAKRPPNITVTTPSGIVIDYWDEIGVDGNPQQRRYAYDGERYVSISTVANIYAKDALTWWGMECGIRAVHILARADAVQVAGFSYDDLVQEVKRQRLTCNDVRDQAAERGTAAHDVLLRLLRDDAVPQLGEYPAEWRPFLQAGVGWFLHHRPEIIDAEVIVASVQHGFAGRYDLHATFPDGRTGRIDFKTSDKPLYDGEENLKHAPYPEHVSQVEGYEIAAVESGYEASDFRAVVRLDSVGRWDMTESWATADHFLGDLAAYRNRRSLTAAKPRKEKATA